MKLNYSEPKIYTGGVNPKQWSKLTNKEQKEALNKDWYVYYSFRNPKTKKLKRQNVIKAGANRIRNKKDRYTFLKTLQRNLSLLLQAGFSPYADNSELIEKFQINGNKNVTIQDRKTPEVTKSVNQTDEIVTREPKTVPDLNQNIGSATKSSSKAKNVAQPSTEVPPQLGMTIDEAFAYGLKIKKSVLNENSYPKYKSPVQRFQKWLEKNNITHINAVDKRTVNKYLNAVLERTSPRNRNNTRATLSSLFTTLEDNDIIQENFILKIKNLRSIPERNKTFTPKQLKELDAYMERNDPLLKLFTQFVSYNFLRPIEICRLKIQDIDIDDRKLYVKAKNKAVKIKIIPDILLNLIPDLSKKNENDFLFTPTGIGGAWDVAETDKRNYFSKRFKKVKDQFNLGKDYGLYSYRHTFITQLYRKLAEYATPLQVKSELMNITGHKTQMALEKYLRDIDAMLPEDYSHLLKNKATI